MSAVSLTDPMNKTGRDLRMTLEIRATAPGDEILSRLITRAVDELGCGSMYVGKSVLLVEEGLVTARVVMTAYDQTWDGERDEARPPGHEAQGVNAERPPSWTPPA